MSKFRKWEVSLAGIVLDTVYFLTGISAAEVRRSLIERDGYNPQINVRLVK